MKLMTWVYAIIFYKGGEVCADYERLKQIIALTHPEETYINIVSNGWLMTREKIAELKELGVDKITFSMDSGIPEEHDENRMSGSHQRVVEAVHNVKESGLLSGISTVVTHDSLYSEGFKKAYEFAEKEKIRFDVQIAEPVGKWDAKSDCLINKDDAKYIYDMYMNSPILPNGQAMIKRDVYRGCEVCCPAGTDFMAITADGNVMPCNFIQATLGNIKERSLREMRNDLLMSKWFSEKYDHCILGENKQFFDEIVYRFKDCMKPLDAYEVFGIN